MLSGTQYPTPVNSRMVVLEYGYQAALKALEYQVDAGTIKGEDALIAIALLDEAENAMSAARVSVRLGDYVSAHKKVEKLISFSKRYEKD